MRALRGRNVQVSHGLAETLSSWPPRPPEFRREVADFCRRPGLPPGPRRRAARRRPRRAQGGIPRPGIRPGAQLRAVRRHHRRDRRVRPAGALPVGERLPRPRDGALRPHPDAGAGVGQQHDVPGHRVRVRRPADRAALPGEGARLGARRAGLVRAGQAVPRRPATVDARRTTTREPDVLDIDRRARQARRRDRATTAGSPSGRRTPPARSR